MFRFVFYLSKLPSLPFMTYELIVLNLKKKDFEKEFDYYFILFTVETKTLHGKNRTFIIKKNVC